MSNSNVYIDLLEWCRYAEFSAAMVGINETFPHEQMNRLLALLQVK